MDDTVQLKLGVVYIFGNAAHRETVVKIGRTNRSAEIRATELSRATGVPTPFRVLYKEAVCDCVRAEKIIHQRLAGFRMNKRREFFDIPLECAIRAVFEACLDVNAEFLTEDSRLVILPKPDVPYIQDFMVWLEAVPGGETSVTIITESRTSKSTWDLSNTLRIQCNPAALIDLKARDWIQDAIYVTRSCSV